MNRKLFLIGAPLSYEQRTFHDGVINDINNYYRFFKSPTGGSFEDHEISYHENPVWWKLKLDLKAFRLDQAVIVFSGHGFIASQSGETRMNLNSYGSASLRDFISTIRSQKQLYHIDSCRTFIEESYFMGDPANGENLRFPSYLQPWKAQQLYEQTVRNSANGVQVLFSCSPGQPSTLQEDGSYFSLSLLKSVRNWSHQINTGSILLPHGAHQLASSYMHQNFSTKQMPELRQSSSQVRLPVALRFGEELFY